MPPFFTHLRLPLLALLASIALTSCFGDKKKDDPEPRAVRCGTGTPPTTTTSTGGTK